MGIKDIFRHIPTLHTERLLLRRIERRDVDDIFEYSHNPETSKFLLWYPHEKKSDTVYYYKAVDKRYKSGEFFDWAIIERSSGKMIGTCGFTSINERDEKAEVGYVINPFYWGRGYATEALLRVIEFGFSDLRLERIEAKYIIGNDASRRVMEKCGMTYEGTLVHSIKAKGRFFDVGVCALVSDMFHKKQ